MCGLAGLAGRGIMSQHLQAYQELLWVSALRGRHSTGVYAARTYRKDLSGVLRKQDTDSAQFVFDHAGRRGILCDMTFDILMGHCRYATVGKVTAKNAHPFDVGSLVGAHNGTLISKEFISPTKTDSEMMFEKMGRVGIEQTLDNLGWGDAYAISVFDKTSRKLFLARNEGRPLYIAIGMKSDWMMWASEYEMLNLVGKRNKLSFKVMELQPHFLYSFDPEYIKAGNEKPYMTTEVKHDDVPWSNFMCE